jgi:hypothetical protein
MRASDADRDRVIDVLKTGFAEGRLTQEEFTERQDKALAARTYGDLAALTADLPVGPPGGLARHAGPFPPAPLASPYPPLPLARRINRLAIASVAAGFIPIFGSWWAIVLGHLARNEIRNSGEGGAGLAAIGIALGYVTMALFLLLLLVPHGGS